MPFPSRAVIKQAFDIRLPAFLLGVLVGVVGMFAFLISLPKGGHVTGPTDDPVQPVWQEVFVPETLPAPLSILAKPIAGPNLHRPSEAMPSSCPNPPAYERAKAPTDPHPPADLPAREPTNPLPPANK